MSKDKAVFHLPGLFEFVDFYSEFLPLYRNNKEYFYEWVVIGSIYGAPADCIWGGGRVGFGEDRAEDVIALLDEYNISGRLTFSNSLLREEHLTDKRCNDLCSRFSKTQTGSGVIVYSDLLVDYLKEKNPDLYLVSSTTKVITDFNAFVTELDRAEFKYVVPDFRLNKMLDSLSGLTIEQKTKVEFLCNERCYIGCTDRKACYENVSRKALGENCPDHICKAPGGEEGYLFSKAKENPAFISVDDIKNIYLPKGFNNFKIEGRSLGSAILLEFLLYYMVKPECQLKVREKIYLDSTLDLF